MDIVKDPGKEAEPEATPTNEKDELRGYNTSLVFKDGEVIVCSILRFVADATLTLSRT